MLRNMPFMQGSVFSTSRDRGACVFPSPPSQQQQPSHTLGRFVAAARSSIATYPSQLRRCITTHACTAAAAASGLVNSIPSSFLFPSSSSPRAASPSLPTRSLPVCSALRSQLPAQPSNNSPRTNHHDHHIHQHAPSFQQQRGLLLAPPCAAAAVEVAVAVVSNNATQELIAVLIGHAVCIGSLFRSLPQILKIVKHRSAEGLSITSHLTEVLCYTITMAYNVKHGYAFNTYGEIFACWIQDIILLSLIFHHLKLSRLAMAASVATFLGVTTFMFSDACPPALLSWMFRATIGVMAFGARLPQIVLNIKRGNAGMMSLTTCCLNVAGNSARVFTTLVLVHDLNVLWGVLTQGILNSILLYQTLSSRLAKIKGEKESAAEKSREEQASREALLPGLDGVAPISAVAAASAVVVSAFGGAGPDAGEGGGGLQLRPA